MVLTRQDVTTVTEATKSDVEKGAYIVKKEKGKLHLTVIATGAEVPTVIAALEGIKLANGITSFK